MGWHMSSLKSRPPSPAMVCGPPSNTRFFGPDPQQSAAQQHLDRLSRFAQLARSPNAQTTLLATCAGKDRICRRTAFGPCCPKIMLSSRFCDFGAVTVTMLASDGGSPRFYGRVFNSSPVMKKFTSRSRVISLA